MNAQSSIAEFDYCDLPKKKVELEKFYDRDGCVIIRNAVSSVLIDEFHERLIGFFRSIVERYDYNQSRSDDLDHLFCYASEHLGESRAKHLLTVGKDFPSYRRLVMSREILHMAETVLQTRELQSAEDNNVMRIDRPGKNGTNLNWHQDYPYNMLTQNALTTWIPILPVTREMGRLQVALPRDDLLDVDYSETQKKQFHNSNYIRISGLDDKSSEFDARATEVPEVAVGDILLIHALVVHKSGENRSLRSRWVATARFGSLVAEEMTERNWFTMRAKYPDIFGSVHPERCHKVD